MADTDPDPRQAARETVRALEALAATLPTEPDETALMAVAELQMLGLTPTLPVPRWYPGALRQRMLELATELRGLYGMEPAAR